MEKAVGDLFEETAEEVWKVSQEFWKVRVKWKTTWRGNEVLLCGWHFQHPASQFRQAEGLDTWKLYRRTFISPWRLKRWPPSPPEHSYLQDAGWLFRP
jgi:hypothetical protein